MSGQGQDVNRLLMYLLLINLLLVIIIEASGSTGAVGKGSTGAERTRLTLIENARKKRAARCAAGSARCSAGAVSLIEPSIGAGRSGLIREERRRKKRAGTTGGDAKGTTGGDAKGTTGAKRKKRSGSTGARPVGSTFVAKQHQAQ